MRRTAQDVEVTLLAIGLTGRTPTVPTIDREATRRHDGAPLARWAEQLLVTGSQVSS